MYLKIEINKNISVVEGSGSPIDLAGLMMFAMNREYWALKQSDPVGAEIFREFITMAISSPKCPLWDALEGTKMITICMDKPPKA